MAGNPPTGTVTFLFTDLVDSTGVLQRLDEEGAEQFRRAHFRILREAVGAHDGQEVKSLGDGLMVAFGSALEATRCAIAMQQAVELHNRRGGEPLNVRVGLHVGEPIQDEDDYFGTPVVTAKRLCDRADGGQVLASDLVRALIGARSGLSLRDLGPLSLKGLREPVATCEVTWEPAPEATASPNLSLVGVSPFVGREREVAVLEAMLRETTSQGTGRVALLAGEPGIGKTRLLMEVAERAASTGWLVLFGRAYESEGMPPYLPFVEALGSHLRGVPDNSLPAELGDRAAELALILPDVARRVLNLPPLPALDPGSERYRLFEAVCDHLAALARGPGHAGLLLGIEDLHWADESTLLLLEHLGRRLQDAPIALLLNYRDTELKPGGPLARTIEQFTRRTQCEHLALRRLDVAGVSSLVAGLSGARPPERLVDVFYSETEGNPFFVHEVYRYLLDEGRLFDSEGRWRSDVRVGEVPQGLRLIIGRRMQRVSEACRRALTFASVIGRVFDFDLLRDVSGMTENDLLDAIDEAERAHLVTSGPDSGTAQLSFTHELIRQALAGDLSLPRRRAIHTGVAEAIECLHGADIAAHAGELAHHFVLGGRRDDLVKAMGYALQAGDRASGQLAFEDAVRYQQMALDVHERSDERDEARHCELLLALATATFRAGDWDRCDEINLIAAKAARAAQLPDLLARACLATAASSPRPNPDVVPILEEALAMVPLRDSPQRSGLLSLLACQRSMAGSWQEQAPMRKESIAMARRVGDVHALAFALRNAYIEWDADRLEERRGAVAEVVDLAREMGDKELELTSQCDHLTTSLLLGDIDAVDTGIDTHVRLGDELQQRMHMVHGLMLRSMRTLLSGPLSLAEEQQAEWARFAHRYRVPWSAPALGSHRLVLRWEQGRLAELEPAYRRALEGEPDLSTRACLAFIYAELGKSHEAEALIEQLGAGEVPALPENRHRTFILALLSQACQGIGKASCSRMLYGLLLPRAAYVVSVDGSYVCLGSTSRYLGLLATKLHQFHDAERHFDDSDSMNARLGAWPLLAHTRVDRAEMHLARNARGDPARARELLEDAARSFESLEMVYHAERARALHGRLSGRASARFAYPDSLSEREAEVLRLIAGGLSNKQIAEQLVLSVRTVERHIANLYLKTGVSTKSQATAYAFGHNLS